MKKVERTPRQKLKESRRKLADKIALAFHANLNIKKQNKMAALYEKTFNTVLPEATLSALFNGEDQGTSGQRNIMQRLAIIAKIPKSEISDLICDGFGIREFEADEN